MLNILNNEKIKLIVLREFICIFFFLFNIYTSIIRKKIIDECTVIFLIFLILLYSFQRMKNIKKFISLFLKF